MDFEISSFIIKAPRGPGVYIFRDKVGPIYVGKAVNVQKRLKFYRDFSKVEPRIGKMLLEARKIEVIALETEIEALLLEINLIKKFKPKYNVIWRDDKRPIYVAISRQELPRVYLSRKVAAKNVQLYGPFPSARKTRKILSFLRKIFPFCAQKTDSHPCPYSYINLCEPCPGFIRQAPSSAQAALKKIYQQNIGNLKLFLRGKIKKVIARLEREMKARAAQENFEAAGQIRDRLSLLKFLVYSKVDLDAYLESPQIMVDIGLNQVKQLGKLLNLSLARIEAYDIANIQGKFATGSMACFISGLPAKDHYRRFRVKLPPVPNDAAMIAEVVQRRLKHRKWPYPDLILADGGKPQVSAIRKVLAAANITIPVVGLAKPKEELVVPTAKGYSLYRLAQDSPAMALLSKIRNEAHRFATGYHKHLRSASIKL